MILEPTREAMFGLVSGTVGINDQGCFTLDDRVLVVGKGSRVLPGGESIERDTGVWLLLGAAWSRGVAAMVRAGGSVSIAPLRWRRGGSGHEGDRPAGMAAGQAMDVHRGVVYDLVVDSSAATPQECASLIAARLT